MDRVDILNKIVDRFQNADGTFDIISVYILDIITEQFDLTHYALREILRKKINNES